MADKPNKSFLSKITIALQFAAVGINSALASIRAFAPNETKLIDVLQYLANVLTAIITQSPVPEVPAALQRKRGEESTILHALAGGEVHDESFVSVSTDQIGELLKPEPERGEIARTV